MDIPPIELIYTVFLSWVFLEALPGFARYEKSGANTALMALQPGAFYPYKSIRDQFMHYMQVLLQGANEVLLLKKKLKAYEDAISFLTKRNQVITRQRDSLGSKVTHLEHHLLNDVEEAKNREIQRVRSGMLHELNTSMTLIAGVVDPLKKDLEELKSNRLTDEAEMLISEASGLVEALDKGAKRALSSTRTFSKILPQPNGRNLLDKDLKDYLEYKQSWYAVTNPEVRFCLLLGRYRPAAIPSDVLVILDHLLALVFESLNAVKAPYVFFAIETGSDAMNLMISYNGVFDYFEKLEERGLDLKLDRADDVVQYLLRRNRLNLAVNRDPDGSGTTCLSVSVPYDKPQDENNLLRSQKYLR